MSTQAKFASRTILWASFALFAQFAAWTGSSSDAFADGTTDAQAALSKGYNDYYKALQGKPDMTPAEKARLFDQLTAPGKDAVNKAVVSQTQETIKNAKPIPEPVRSWTHSSSGNQPAAAQSATLLSPASASVPEPYHHPETVLDGSGIPREIEFSGPKKATPSPRAAVPKQTQ